jgi:hypothetical protein
LDLLLAGKINPLDPLYLLLSHPDRTSSSNKWMVMCDVLLKSKAGAVIAFHRSPNGLIARLHHQYRHPNLQTISYRGVHRQLTPVFTSLTVAPHKSQNVTTQRAIRTGNNLCRSSH